MSTSQNGWLVFTSSASLVSLPWITGRVRPGDVYFVFDYLCRRFNSEVEPIRRHAEAGGLVLGVGALDAQDGPLDVALVHATTPRKPRMPRISRSL